MPPTSCGKSQGRTDALPCSVWFCPFCAEPWRHRQNNIMFEVRKSSTVFKLWRQKEIDQLSVHINKASDECTSNYLPVVNQRGSQRWCFQPVSLRGHKLPNVKGIVHQKWVQMSCFSRLVWRHSQHSPSVWKSSDIFLYLLLATAVSVSTEAAVSHSC